MIRAFGVLLAISAVAIAQAPSNPPAATRGMVEKFHGQNLNRRNVQ